MEPWVCKCNTVLQLPVEPLPEALNAILTPLHHIMHKPFRANAPHLPSSHELFMLLTGLLPVIYKDILHLGGAMSEKPRVSWKYLRQMHL
jgi:hypothetical protein